MFNTIRKLSFQLSGYWLEIVLALSGVLAGSVFALGLTAWIIPLLLVPLIYALTDSSRSHRGLMNSCLLACYFLLPFYLLVFSWFLTASPGNVAIRHNLVPLTNGLSLLFVAFVYTICALPFAWLTHLILSRHPGRYAPYLVIPTAWIISEWTSSVGFSIVVWGHGGSVGDYWNFGNLGLAAMDSPLAFLSRYVGLYGLSFLVILLAVALSHGFAAKSVKLPAVILAGICLAALGASASSHAVSTQPDSLRHGSVLQEADFTMPPGGTTAIQNRSAVKKDLIVLPEYSNVFTPGYENYAAAVNDRLSSGGVSIDVSSEKTPNSHYSALQFRNNQGRIVSARTKQLLIPTGEYMPLVLSALFDVSGQPGLVSNFDRVYALQRGQTPTVFKHGDLTLGSVACSGILARSTYRQFADAGVQVFTNSANLDIFQGSQSYFRQSLQMARFHAVANDRVFIQASQGAAAFVINGRGQFIVKPQNSGTKFIDFDFTASTKKTIYTRLGEWVLPVSTVGLVLVGLKSFRPKR